MKYALFAVFSKCGDLLSIPDIVFILFHVKHADHVDARFGLLCADVPGERTGRRSAGFWFHVKPCK